VTFEAPFSRMTLSLPIACATCLPDKGSAVGQAQGLAILVMLAVLAFMFLCAGGIVFTLALRQKKHAASLAA
jgi:hypothetical protein